MVKGGKSSGRLVRNSISHSDTTQKGLVGFLASADADSSNSVTDIGGCSNEVTEARGQSVYTSEWVRDIATGKTPVDGIDYHNSNNKSPPYDYNSDDSDFM